MNDTCGNTSWTASLMTAQHMEIPPERMSLCGTDAIKHRQDVQSSSSHMAPINLISRKTPASNSIPQIFVFNICCTENPIHCQVSALTTTKKKLNLCLTLSKYLVSTGLHCFIWRMGTGLNEHWGLNFFIYRSSWDQMMANYSLLLSCSLTSQSGKELIMKLPVPLCRRYISYLKNVFQVLNRAMVSVCCL